MTPCLVPQSTIPNIFPKTTGGFQSQNCRKGTTMFALAEFVRSSRKQSSLFESLQVSPESHSNQLAESQPGQIHQSFNDLQITGTEVHSGFPDVSLHSHNCDSFVNKIHRVTAGCMHSDDQTPLKNPSSVTVCEQTSYAHTSALVSASLPPSSLPLDWLLGPKQDTPLNRLLAAFVRVEAQARKDGDVWFAEDVRQAEIAFCHFMRGEFSSFIEASAFVCLKFFGVNASKLQNKIVANRKVRLGKEYYDFYDSENRLRPDIPTIKKPPVADVEPNERIAALLAHGVNTCPQSDVAAPAGPVDTPPLQKAGPVSRKEHLA